MQKSSEIKLWVTGKVESSEVTGRIPHNFLYSCVPRAGARGRARGRGRARNPARSQDAVFGASWQKSNALIGKSGSITLWGPSRRF